MVSTSWLTKQRKSDLIDLAEQAGLDIDETFTKPAVVEALDEHLQANAKRLSRDPAFDGFYKTTRTPHKARDDTGDDSEVKSIVRGRGRRLTKAKPDPAYQNEDDEDEDNYSAPPRPAAMASTPIAPVRRTPTRTILQQRHQSLPPSPTVVVDEVEHATTRFYAGLDDIYTLSGVPEAIDWARESCSSLVAVHLTFLLMETYGLSTVVMPWKYVFDIPSSYIIGTPSIAVKVPDLFALLSASFWYPTLLWSATSIFVPLLFAYFFNLTVHTVKRNNARVRVVRYNYDPFTFNVVKSMLISTVYGANILNGYVSYHTVASVASSQYGGYTSMLMGTYVCGLCALWEATQR